MEEEAQVVHDGCIKIVKWVPSEILKGQLVQRVQRKRRPDKFRDKPDECSWFPSVHCDDHPNR